MTNNDLEKFDKMKTAGNLAARTLDLITEYIKPGITTNDIDKLGYEFKDKSLLGADAGL